MQTTTVYRKGNAFESKVYTIKLQGLRGGGGKHEKAKTFAKTDIDLASYCSQDNAGNRDLTLELRWGWHVSFPMLAWIPMLACGSSCMGLLAHALYRHATLSALEEW
jgi:hypothetical protein